MAQGRYTREHSSFSNFSILDGVMVKIGDKFRPPLQVELPSGIGRKNPTTLLEFDYDFSLEERVIASSEQEKRLKEKQAILEDTENTESTDNDTSSEPSSSITEQNSTESNSDALLDPVCDILTPISLPVSSKAFNNKKVVKSYKDFNLSEFEDNNVTPFELVELQTINDLDELKSVLQPEEIKAKKSPSTPDSTLTLPPPTTTNDTEPTTSSLTTVQVTDGSFSFLTAGGGVNDNCRGIISRGPSTINSSQECYEQNSAFLIRIESNDNMSNHALSNCNSVPPNLSAGLSKDLNSTNLISTNSKSLPSLVTDDSLSTENANEVNEFGGFPLASGDKSSCNIVPTQRINDIMKQYQFTRIIDGINVSGGTNGQVPVTVSSTCSLAFPRHGQLPPMSHSAAGLTTSTSVQYNVSDDTVTVAGMPTPVHSPQLQPLQEGSSSPIKGQDIRTPQTPVIPPIRQSPSFGTNATDVGRSSPGISGSIRLPLKQHWLPDPTSQLTEPERIFVNSIAGMGFPIHRVARAVKRIGMDEKKVVEFLVHVQQLSDMGYSSDDVEAALTQNDSIDEALKYLQVFRTLKEFGFLESNIQDALRRTSGDRDAALEILMS